MTDAVAEATPPATNEAVPPAVPVRRTPLYLESQGQWLFAWLHRPAGAAHASHGIVVCPPVGHEQVHAHRGLRHLAEALAGAGFPCLRLDYHGTGDSPGTQEEADRLPTWLANIRDAQAWLRRHLGCARITLAGLRLGAALASLAAAEQEVDGLLLWAPVLRGRTYVREMKALALAGGASEVASADLEAGGFVLPARTIEELGTIDLLQTRPRCRRALLLARDDMPAEMRLLDHLAALGIDADQAVPPGYADLMREPHYTKVPYEAIARAVAWLRLAGPAQSETVNAPDGAAWPTEIVIPQERAIRERALRIAGPSELFGIISEPCAAPARPLPFVVLVNAGSSYRVGPGRLYVWLARQLAGHGFACLRLDLCGLGDSVSPDSERENDPYPATAFRDIDVALAHLHSQGVERVVLLGLCSGAYAAFHCAARLANPALVESVLLNPLTFYWREGMSLEAAPAEQIDLVYRCKSALLHPGKWLKFLSGGTSAGPAAVLRALWQGCRARLARRGPVRPSELLAGVPAAHPPGEDLAGDLDRIVAARRHLACFFAGSDPGHRLLMFQAGRKVNALCAAGRMDVKILDGADHTFSRRAWRQALGRALTEHLCRRYARST